ncbi:MAG TPA: hypothetical protein VFX22_07090 [Candidatus Kapabacteria bacterium]|nr:hypothetical protein [Candidatus Kapabacteria bacterium]
MVNEIFIYESESGQSHFEKWYRKLNKTVRTRIQVVLLGVAAGNFGDSKPIGEGVVELKLAKELWGEYKRGKGYASKAMDIYS